MMALSQVRNWDTSHLHAAASHWEAVAADWKYSFDAVHQESFAPGGSEWTGEGADAAQYRTAVDRKYAWQAADTLRDAAAIARDGASEIEAAKADLLRSIRRVQEDGFVVGEDFSIADTKVYPARQAAIREAQVDRHAAAITDGLQTLTALDRRVAGQMKGRIFAADFPLDTTPPPPPPDPITVIQRQLQETQKQVDQQQQEIDKLQEQRALDQQPTLEGLGVAAGLGCAGGAGVTFFTGPGAGIGCATGAGIAGIGYMLSKIWG